MARRNPAYFRIDENSNAVDSIVQASQFSLMLNDAMRWKWVIFAIDHALYMFSIIALTSTDYSRVLLPIKCSNPKCKRRSTLDNIRDEDWRCPHCGTNLSKIAQENLIPFDEAVSRIQSEDWMHQFLNSKWKGFTIEELELVKRLHKYLRNKIQHFVPTLSSIEIKYIKQALAVAVDLIDFLVFQSGNIHLSQPQKKRVRKSIRLIRPNIVVDP